MADALRHLGVHLPQMGNLPAGGSFGNWIPGTLIALYDAIGLRPRDFPRTARPVVTLKRQVPLGVSVPQMLTDAAIEAVKLGCLLHVQEVEYSPDFPGPIAGVTETDWARGALLQRFASLDAWLTEIGADRRSTLISYGNEYEMEATAGGGLKVWNGQPGSADPAAEYYHREAAFMEGVRDLLRCLPAFGNDASVVGTMRSLQQRLSIFRAWAVEPAALVYHGYGAGGHHAVHVPILRAAARHGGFRGRLLAGEVAKRVDTSAGDETDRNRSGEWWRQYADEVRRHPDHAACFFQLYELAVAQMLAAFQAPVPTGISTALDPDDVGLQAWGLTTASLPEELRATDTAGVLAGLRAARQAR